MTLAVSRDEVRAAIAMQVGWPIPAQWSIRQETQFEIIFKRAQRQIYYPPILPGEKSPHEWSWLSPWQTLSIVADVADYDLPDDFAGMIDEFTYLDYSVGSRSVTLTTDVEIRRLRQMAHDGTGYPEKAAIIPLPSDGDQPQTWQVHFWPTPAAAYELRYRYAAVPHAMSASKTYPLGGTPFADAFLSSCLAAAESELDDKRDIRFADFVEKLAAAVAYDRNRNVQSLGYCGDRSVEGPREWSTINVLTYNGDEL